MTGEDGKLIRSYVAFAALSTLWAGRQLSFWRVLPSARQASIPYVSTVATKHDKTIERPLSAQSRQKVYLILAAVSIALLFYSVWQIRPVVVDVQAPLGLLSYLPVAYWLGLALLVVDSIFAFLDRELRRDVIFLALLLALGLFLFGMPAFVEENARNPDIYRNSEVYNLLASHHIDLEKPLISYYSWPGLHFISASLITVTGMDLSFMKYVPLFYVLLLVLITYSMGKRLELTANQCFALSFLTLSSWLFMSDYTNYAVGMLLYLLLLMLLITPRRTAAETVIVVLVFGGLVITHGFSAVAVLPALAFLSLLRRETRFIALFAVVFASWMMYHATTAMELGVQSWLTAPFLNIWQASQTERYEVPAVVARSVTRYSQLGYLALYGVAVLGSAVLILWGKITGQEREKVLCLFAWAIGVALLVASAYGQATYRTYLFAIVPAVSITVLAYSGRKATIPLVAAVMAISVFLFLPANYGAEAAFSQVLTSELKGAQFFAQRVNPSDVFFYGADANLFYYYNPNLMEVPIQSPPGLGKDQVDFSGLNRSHYVLISEQATRSWTFGLGEYPYDNWPQTEGGQRAGLLYDNGYFQVYANQLAR